MNKFFRGKVLRVTVYSLFGLSLFILLWIVILRLLGFQLNKDFFTFNQQQCIEKEYPTYPNHSGIAGCVFWSRHDDLESKQNWQALFQRDDAYCKQTYGYSDNTDFAGSLHRNLTEGRDPKCNYEGIRQIKRNENWDYLISKDKDQFYYSCVEQLCPTQKLFK
ncbi:hypothetical protein HYS92_00180 [Candidatus Daviesbacteria bacterium]|nr:hypothetical protein [Candidatus Daviesbacteria bacterium]